MPNYALYDNEGNIVNIFLLEEDSDWTCPEGFDFVTYTENDVVEIGGSYKDGVFFPAPKPTPDPQPHAFMDNFKIYIEQTTEIPEIDETSEEEVDPESLKNVIEKRPEIEQCLELGHWKLLRTVIDSALNEGDMTADQYEFTQLLLRDCYIPE